MRLFKCVTAFVMISLVSSPVFAHTNSIGYVGDGNGGLTFWYGSWHDNTQFNEAEIKIEGANGTTFTAQIDEFDLLSQDSPAGLISGVNFFTSDGTQLIDYDPDDPNGGGESYTWQGINYANLQPGDYTFTYIPLGDAESSYPTGTPTQEWVPMDQVIRTLTITLTQNDLDGDANNNGILDVNEVAVGSASGGPTVTGQGSSTIVAHTAVSSGALQTISRTSTTSTWDIYSDGTTGTATSTSTTLDPLVGRIDQIDTANHMLTLTHKNIEWDGVTIVKYNSDATNGMSGDVSGLTASGIKKLESGWGFGIGVAKLEADANGADGTVGVSSTTFHVETIRDVYYGDISVGYTRSSNDYTVNRTIGSFANKGVTSGTDRYYRVKYTGEGKVRPVLGLTKGTSNVDGYTETGSIQSARTVMSDTDDYRYASFGVEFDLGSFNGSAVRHTDGTNEFSIGASKKQDDNTVFLVELTRIESELVSANSIRAGINIPF